MALASFELSRGSILRHSFVLSRIRFSRLQTACVCNGAGAVHCNDLLASMPDIHMRTLMLRIPPCFKFTERGDDLIYHLVRCVPPFQGLDDIRERLLRLEPT